MMSDRSRVAIGRTMAAVGFAAATIGMIWLLAMGFREVLWVDWIVHNALVGASTGVIVWLVIRPQPRNVAVWILAWSGLFTGLEVLGYALLGYGTDTTSSAIFQLAPADLPLGLALIAMQVNWLWIGVLLLLTVLYVFPDGETLSPTFKWLFRLMLVTIALTSIGLFWEARPSSTVSLNATQNMEGGFSSLTASLVTIGYPTAFLLAIGGFVSMVIRFRHSVGVVRQQFRWVAWGASVTVVTLIAALLMDEVGDRLDVSLYLGAIGFLALIVSIGVAIGKYRLYDIDVVISRTLVYGTLAVFIGVVYVGIAVVPWIVLGSEAEANTWLGIVATVIVAVSFQPVRRWLERVANRIVYGRRATPYEVLSSFSQGISAVDPEVLVEAARSLAEGTTAESASVWVGEGEGAHRLAVWPSRPVGEVDGSVVSAPVSHDGEVLGRVELVVAPGQPFPVTDRRLLDQVAGGLGLALRNMQLTEDLRDRVVELAASRRRIVSVQDETRRKLERDLHDGAQQRLVSLKIKLGIGSSLADKAGLDDVKSMIDVVRAETDQTIDSVRDFARGIYPPLLEAEGLGAALSAQARKMPIPVTVQAAGLGRYPKEQEATVYFCVLEALQNAMKHSEASSVQVVLSDSEDELAFEVRDDGVGFDQASVDSNGLINMTDRVEAVGGQIHIQTQPGRGTVITASMPHSVGEAL